MLGIDTSVIIPCAGLGRRMKCFGSKSLLDLGNGQNIINRQINIVRKMLPFVDIIVITGPESAKVEAALPKSVRVIENCEYATTNVARSIAIGLKASVTEKVLIVYGDLVFSSNIFQYLNRNTSCILIDDNNYMKDGEVGIILDEHGNLSRMAYGLPNKWMQILWITGKEIDILKSVAYNRDYDKHFGFELLNLAVDNGAKLKGIFPQGCKIIDVDTSGDIAIAQRIAQYDK